MTDQFRVHDNVVSQAFKDDRQAEERPQLQNSFEPQPYVPLSPSQALPRDVSTTQINFSPTQIDLNPIPFHFGPAQLDSGWDLGSGFGPTPLPHSASTLSKPHKKLPTRQLAFCPYCEDRSKKFSGEHALRRHIDQTHSVIRKVWVCKDISSDGKFLLKCKACRNGQKYNVSDDAAAHLRRSHFLLLNKPRGGRGKGNETRDGEGTGDQPPMDVLKHWMFEKEERVLDNVSASISQNLPKAQRPLPDTYGPFVAANATVNVESRLGKVYSAKLGDNGSSIGDDGASLFAGSTLDKTSNIPGFQGEFQDVRRNMDNESAFRSQVRSTDTSFEEPKSYLRGSPETDLERYIPSEGERTASDVMSLSSEASLESFENYEITGDLARTYERFLQDVLKCFEEKLDFSASQGVKSHAPTKRTASQASGQNDLGDTSVSQTSEGKKRLPEGRQGNSRKNDDDDQDSPQRPRNSTRASKAPLEKLLACPYFKFDPSRYSEGNQREKDYRCCSSKYLLDINRVKSHLYRVHCKPSYYCGRCYAEFNTQEQLDEHTRQRIDCEICDVPKFIEKMTTDQRNRIRKRAPGRSVEENWFALFRILFPEVPLPNSPYLQTENSQIISNFLSFFRSEAPGILQSTLRAEFLEAGQFYSDEIGQAMLRSAVEQCIERITSRSPAVLGGSENYINQVEPIAGQSLPDIGPASSPPNLCLDKTNIFPISQGPESRSSSSSDEPTPPSSQEMVETNHRFVRCISAEEPLIDQNNHRKVLASVDLGLGDQSVQPQLSLDCSNPNQIVGGTHPASSLPNLDLDSLDWNIWTNE